MKPKYFIQMLIISEITFFRFHNFSLYFFKDFIYLFMRDTEREAEGESGSLQGV